MPALAAQPLIMGQVSGVFGIKGWVRVFDYSRERGAILAHQRWLLRQGEKMARSSRARWAAPR